MSLSPKETFIQNISDVGIPCKYIYIFFGGFLGFFFVSFGWFVDIFL